MTGFQLTLPDELPLPARAGHRLRHARPDDAPAFVAIARESVDTIGRFMGWAHAGYGEPEAGAWIAHCQAARASGDAFEYVLESEGGALLGGFGLNHLDRIHRRANLGYWVRGSAQGRGLASEAGRTLAIAGLTAGLVRVEVIVEVDNLPSQRVAEKLGAARESVLRSRIFLRDEPRDAIGYALVRGDG